MNHQAYTVQTIKRENLLAPNVPLIRNWIVTWTITVEACDRLRAARIALQKLLSSDKVEVTAAPFDGFGIPCKTIVPARAQPFKPMSPGLPPLRVWTIVWSTVQVACNVKQAGLFALNNLLWEDEFEFSVADQFLTDCRLVKVSKKKNAPMG